MMGIDIRKENFAADSLVKPWKSPTEMVIPERETPGIRATA
jgi:hypothetical protein